MKIKIFDFPLKDELKEKVEKLLEESFDLKSGANPKYIETSKNTHYSNPVKYILYFDVEKLIGIQMIFLRKVVFENRGILIGGLGGLCVDKKYRGQGIAKILLSEAIKVIKDLNCDVGILFTNVKDSRYIKLYGTFGFVALNREYSFMDKMGNLHKDNSCMIASVNSIEKFNLILNSKEILNLGAGEW